MTKSALTWILDDFYDLDVLGNVCAKLQLQKTPDTLLCCANYHFPESYWRYETTEGLVHAS